jgi:hypothetical protein
MCRYGMPRLSRWCHTARAETKLGFQKIACGTKPLGRCQASSARSSSAARSRSKRDQTIAWKHESQNHWNGYDGSEGREKRSVRPSCSTVRVLAASSERAASIGAEPSVTIG